MEGSFDDEEFEVFRRQSVSREEVDAQLAAIKHRLTAFLAERGVPLSAPEGASNEEIAETAAHQMEVLALAALIASHQAMAEYRGEAEEPPADYKKRLQASYMAKGYGGPWQELIDAELEGQPLTEDDIGLISEMAAATFSLEEESARRFEALYDSMEEFLLVSGAEELDADSQTVMVQLIVLLGSVFEGHSPVNKVEDARILVHRAGLTDPAWEALIQHFFIPE